MSQNFRLKPTGQANIANRPLLNTTSMGGYPALTFDSSNDFLTGQASGFGGGNSAMTLYQTFDVNTVSTASFAFGNADAGKERWKLDLPSNQWIINDYHSGSV